MILNQHHPHRLPAAQALSVTDCRMWGLCFRVCGTLHQHTRAGHLTYFRPTKIHLYPSSEGATWRNQKRAKSKEKPRSTVGDTAGTSYDYIKRCVVIVRPNFPSTPLLGERPGRSCITQRKAHGPSRTCNEKREEEDLEEPEEGKVE